MLGKWLGVEVRSKDGEFDSIWDGNIDGKDSGLNVGQSLEIDLGIIDILGGFEGVAVGFDLDK